MSHIMLEYCNRSIRYFFKSEREAPELCQKEREEMGRVEVGWINESLKSYFRCGNFSPGVV
jgi:hypothetical protein